MVKKILLVMLALLTFGVTAPAAGAATSHKAAVVTGSTLHHAKRRDGGPHCTVDEVGFHLIAVSGPPPAKNDRWEREAWGDVTCVAHSDPLFGHFAPLSFTSQVCIQRYERVEGHPGRGWVDVGCTPFDHHVPNPDGHFWKDMPCATGLHRGQLEIWGTNYKHHDFHMLRHSVIHHVNSCKFE